MGFAFDPIAGHNDSAASSVFQALTDVIDSTRNDMSIKSRLEFMGPLSPQQNDGFNCGVYTVLFIDWMAKLIFNEARVSAEASSDVTQTAVKETSTATSLKYYTGGDTLWLQDMRKYVTRSSADKFRADILTEIEALKKKNEDK